MSSRGGPRCCRCDRPNERMMVLGKSPVLSFIVFSCLVFLESLAFFSIEIPALYAKLAPTGFYFPCSRIPGPFPPCYSGSVCKAGPYRILFSFSPNPCPFPPCNSGSICKAGPCSLAKLPLLVTYNQARNKINVGFAN